MAIVVKTVAILGKSVVILAGIGTIITQPQAVLVRIGAVLAKPQAV